MRLDKLLANMGFGSRKEVKFLLKEKRVTVNGQVQKNGSIHVDPESDRIEVDGERTVYEKYIYLMMNKPKGVISATKDSRERTVVDLLSKEEKWFQPFPVGRLDKDTEGLLILTNDGELAHQLTSPNKNVEKTYFAKIKGRVTAEDTEKFQQGVTLDDGYHTKPAKLNIIASGEQSEVEITITEGKFHQVKRMFLAVDKKVMYLKRIRMGDITLDTSLAPGEYRRLTEKELNYCLSLKR